MWRALSAVRSSDRLQEWSGRNGLPQWRRMCAHPLAPGLSWYTYISYYICTHTLARAHTHTQHSYIDVCTHKRRFIQIICKK